MLQSFGKITSCLSISFYLLSSSLTVHAYDNFNVAIYARVYEVQKMADLQRLEEQWKVISTYVKVDKIYLETHRDMVVAGQDTISMVKKFFNDRGIKTSGGITITVSERNRFQTYCYTNPEQRRKLQLVVEFTARNFDEIILDDFFFTNCKCESCINAKGNRSWTDFRLDLMTKATQELILQPAKRVNPRVTVIIKYPNWYEHFQGLGFNLETEPALFDGLYTGTETRDPSSNQHLQPYLGYLIFRYFENLKPGGNRGGWVDTGGISSLDRYAEQLWLTLFAKAPELTLFDFRQMQRTVDKSLRASWQGQGTSFDFDKMIEPVRLPDGTWPAETTFALPVGYTFEQIDKFLGRLGKPVGVKSYKPFHSTGEDFLQTYFGMIGLPMDIVPDFPSDEKMIILTESAKFDPNIVKKIEGQLVNGKNVLITSGLLTALQDKGLGDIVELYDTGRKALVNKFRAGWGPLQDGKSEMLIPQIQYLTNDSWEEISAFNGTNGWPLLHSAGYGKGTLYVLTVPENFVDLYNLPAAVLNRIRETILRDMPVRIEAPGQVSIFVYDNDTFIVESFLDEATQVKIVIDDQFPSLMDVNSGEMLKGEKMQGMWGQPSKKIGFTTEIKPHSFRVFKYQK